MKDGTGTTEQSDLYFSKFTCRIFPTILIAAKRRAAKINASRNIGIIGMVYENTALQSVSNLWKNTEA